ncbi:MAG: EAL domain-containing protein, partial [Rhodospirillales bacterium]|nr:EAL domain-containing protein [Rhodospirillales bacterium]
AFAGFQQVIVKQVPVTLEYRLLHADGREIHMLTHAEPVRGPDGRTALVRGTTQDITSFRRIEAALRESEDHHRHMVELHPQIPWTAGPDGGVLEAGPQWYALTGMTPATSIPNGWVNAVHADDRAWVAQAWMQVVQSAGRLDIEFRVRSASGISFWMRSRAAPRFDANGEVVRWYGTLENVTEKRLAQESLRFAAEHDVLTGTLNRAALFTEINLLLSRRPGLSRPVLLCLDLDYFKDVNDRYGHQVGDEVLRQIASRITSFLGPGDRLARIGGDEFMIMLAGVEAKIEVSAFADQLAKAMQTPFTAAGLSLSSSVSIGAAIASPADTLPDQLYRKADMALHAAKTRARGSYLMFDSEMERDLEAKRRLRVDLSIAISTGQLFLEFQPIVKIDDHQIAGVEALLRWQHPEFGHISPDEFIPIAEETGMIAEIGAWVMREAAFAATSFPQDVKISVNVSPRQLELGDIVSLVAATLVESGLAPHRLKLEITESVLMQKVSANLTQLHALRELGVMIVLDDFGSGYSSLSYLDSFRFDFIKIDKSFLTNIHGAADSYPIFEAIIAMTYALKIPVTVEGVETQTQMDYVTRLGCDYAQGYFLARPMERKTLLNFLHMSNPL